MSTKRSVEEIAKEVRLALKEADIVPNDIVDPHDGSMERKAEQIIAAAQRAERERKVPKGHVLNSDGVALRIADCLPITSDNCVVTPWMSVVYHPAHPGQMLEVDVLGDEVVGQLCELLPDGSGTQCTEYPIGECYADREAAEAAAKEVQGE